MRPRLPPLGILFLILITPITGLLSFCNDYIRCMEQLEIKQHECLALDRNVRLKGGDECTIKKWDKKLELNALHMRRVEIARDCAQKFELDSKIAESTLDEETHSKCVSLHDKFQFAKNITQVSPTEKRRRKRSMTSRRSKRDNSSKKAGSKRASECRNAARIWHRQCSALAKCCPLAEECKQSTQEIMEQIYQERHQLHDLSTNNCQ